MSTDYTIWELRAILTAVNAEFDRRLAANVRSLHGDRLIPELRSSRRKLEQEIADREPPDETPITQDDSI
jgi:hypothetical protein